GEVLEDFTGKTTGTFFVKDQGSLKRTEYTFVGWNSNRDGSGTDYNVGEEKLINQDLTLYAQWEKSKYIVSYETDGGTTLSDITVAHNQTITKPTGVTKQGHSLEGWYTDTNLTMKYDFTTPVTSNLTLYAKWVANSYTVTFNVTGGTTLAPKTILFNEKVMMPQVPTKVGYTFAGWYKEATYTTEWNFLTDVVTGNITLYAKWTVNTITWTPPTSTNNNSNNPIPTMKITLHTNGGTEIEPIDIAYNTKISDLPVPTRKGFRFGGWYEDVELTKPWVEGTVIRENISLYTKWIEITEDLPKIPYSKISDIDGHWAQAAIEELIELGIIRGYEDGTFRPNESISRKHVAALLTRTFTLEAVRGTVDFQDVPLTHSDYDAIQNLQRAGIIDGSNGKFLPEEKMTRAQLAKVLVMLMGITPEGVSSFSDVDSHHWSANYIAVLEREGITLGDNGKFHPNTPVTRAQFVTFLYRIMQKNNV
ncbi:MAG TPA: InlB B-repeat-containing protein, partial [Solibacillus sp.]